MKTWLESLASLKLTAAAIAAFALAVGAGYWLEWPMTWPVAAPMLVLSANLAAALAVNLKFRRQTALLVFHIALLLLALLVVAGRLTHLNGTAEVVVGGEFSGLTRSVAGPFHFGRIDAVRFRNDGFSISYLPGPKRDKTLNRVRWIDESGAERVTEIGDNLPLVLHGYRFYPTFNKGFAPIYVWAPTRGEPLRGSIHLPAWPLNEFKQSLDWTLPGTQIALWSQLDFSEKILLEDAPSSFRPPRDYQLVMRRGEERWSMRPGDRRVMPEGTLVFEGLGTWMGYQVFYDWTLPWLLGVALLAVASMGWHFWQKYFSRPW